MQFVLATRIQHKVSVFFSTKDASFYRINTVPMLIWCFKHTWFRSFRSINPAPAAGLSGFICRSGFIAKTFTFKELIWFMIAQLAIFKFNSTNARILLLYPYNVVGGTNRNRTNHHHFDKRDAPIGRGKTKKRPVIDHESKRLIFFNKYIKLQWNKMFICIV